MLTVTVCMPSLLQNNASVWSASSASVVTYKSNGHKRDQKIKTCYLLGFPCNKRTPLEITLHTSGQSHVFDMAL